LQTNGIVGKEFEYVAIIFFDLQNGLKLAMWPRKSLAHDSGISVIPSGQMEFSIGHKVNSPKEADETME
jgi:uncharacterized protein